MFMLVLLLSACAPAADDTNAEEHAASYCEAARNVAALPRDLHEASGVALSIRHPGILWAHNDSGEPVLFAIDTLGNLRARITLSIPNTDWEDIEVGKCPEGSCLYVGAIGDNHQSRNDRAVFRFIEPALDDQRIQPVARYRYRLPSGPQDSEALVVMPDQRMLIITKGRSGPITLFGFPQPASADEVNSLDQLQFLTPGLVQLPDMVSAAGATPDGKVVVIRSYSALQLYTFDGARLNPLLAGAGFDLQSLHEFQGEGVDITGDGTVYLVSEKGLSDDDPSLSKANCHLSLR
jgi:hypothetical protein